MAPSLRPSAHTPAFSRRTFLYLGSTAVVGVVVAGCGDDSEAPPTGQATSDPVTAFTIVADRMAWDLDRVVVPAGREITATIDNRDRGMPHNLHVRSPGDPKTELENGPVTQTLRFTIDEPGSYEFVCDAHLYMTGTIEAV